MTVQGYLTGPFLGVRESTVGRRSVLAPKGLSGFDPNWCFAS